MEMKNYDCQEQGSGVCCEECADCRFHTGQVVGDYAVVSNPPQLKALLDEIFTPEFMCRHSSVKSFEAFQYSSAVVVNWGKDPLIYRPVLLDTFVREVTDFSSWDEMVKQAADEHFQTKQILEKNQRRKKNDKAKIHCSAGERS